MPIHEFMGMLTLLIVGGNDMTRNPMTGGLRALHEHPEEYEKLRGNPGLIPGMVSEIVIYANRHSARTLS